MTSTTLLINTLYSHTSNWKEVNQIQIKDCNQAGILYISTVEYGKSLLHGDDVGPATEVKSSVDEPDALYGILVTESRRANMEQEASECKAGKHRFMISWRREDGGLFPLYSPPPPRNHSRIVANGLKRSCCQRNQNLFARYFTQLRTLLSTGRKWFGLSLESSDRQQDSHERIAGRALT